jgi:hypothetical protein
MAPMAKGPPAPEEGPAIIPGLIPETIVGYRNKKNNLTHLYK